MRATAPACGSFSETRTPSQVPLFLLGHRNASPPSPRSSSNASKMLGDDKFEIRPMGRGFVKIGGAETDPADIKLAEECWQAGRDAIYSGKYDLVVLDEINYTISYKMLDAAEVVEALKSRPERVHVICTGRNAHPKLVELADLVTEMREVKHPYTKGILAQRGIDY